jgi:hypothetical protein
VNPIATTENRVKDNTAEEINRRIRRDTDARVARFARIGSDAITERLEELDREWDIERCLETAASSLTLLGAVFGLANRKWLLVPAAVGGFLLQHAIQGWCPPLPVFRRMGFRTADEINEERFALKALRGDFAEVRGQSGICKAGLARRANLRTRRHHDHWHDIAHCLDLAAYRSAPDMAL